MITVLPQRNRREQGVEGGSRSTDAQRLCDGGGQRKFLLYISQRLDRVAQVLSPATSLSRARSLGRSQARYSVAPLLTLRPKIGSRKIPDFSLFISQNLLKSRVFLIYIMGLFFPDFGVEQAHFSHLTTCLTTCGDFWLIFDCLLIVLRR